MTQLRDRIGYWIGQGFQVVSETPTSAQLIRKRRFNPTEFLAMPIYLVEYVGQRDRTVYLSVGDDGTVDETGSAFETSRYRRAQAEMSAGRRLAIAALVLFGGAALIVVVSQLLR